MEKTASVSRRDLAKAAGMAAFATGAPAIVKAAPDQIRFGRVGAGSRGDYLLSHLAKIDNGRCTALCHINQEHLDRSAKTIGANPAKHEDYRELLTAPPPVVTKAGEKKAYVAGVTMVAANGQTGVPILLDRDKVTPNTTFVDKEIKYARQWLYSKGVMMPEEPKNPVDTELTGFLNDRKTGGRPRANIDVGLADSFTVMLTNLAIEEDSKALYSEIAAWGAKTQKA